MNFVFWQNMPTHHQSAWIAALASEEKCGVWVALEGGIPEWRRNLGWDMPNYGDAAVEVGFTPESVSRVIWAAGPDAVHVFSGLGAYRGVHAAFRRCAREGRRVGLMAEAKAKPMEGLRGLGRLLAGRVRVLRFGGRIDFVLAIGANAPRWFQRLGFARDRIFEFAYFPPAPSTSEEGNECGWAPGAVRLLYIGQLIRRKGIDRLLNALAKISANQWHLDLVGGGGGEPDFRALAGQLGIDSRIAFSGTMSNSDAMAVLSGADVLILPSRSDGYGAVVNEALLRGVPVICSAECGARQVVEMHPDFGTVFDSDSTLRAGLERCIAQGRRTEAQAQRIRNLAQCLTPPVGASYFANIIKHVYGTEPRPAAPWRRLNRGEVTTN